MAVGWTVFRGLWLLGGGLLALTLMGCSAARPKPPVGDPLFGNQPPVPEVKPGTPVPPPSARGALPALPAPSEVTSPAALANGNITPLESGRELRIGPPPKAQLGGAETVSTSAGPTTGVKLQPPQPTTKTTVPTEPTPSGLAPITLAGGATVYVQSVDHAIKLLEDRGMKAFRLELQRDSGLWRCTCSLASRENPSLKRTYDTRASDRLAAMRALIEQIERENP